MTDRKIFFGGSMFAGRQDERLYQNIIEHLKSYGEVLTEHVVGSFQPAKLGVTTEKQMHDKDIELLQAASFIIAEVTQPSLGVGYELATAKAMGKNILCLYRPQPGKKLSPMVTGAQNGTTFIVKEYSGFEEVPAIMKEYFASK